jgi:oligopeptide transport system permease protein
MSDQLETPDVDVRETDEQPDVATRTVGAAGAAATAAIGAEAVGGQASLWSDAWLELRRNPLFLGPLLIILVLTVMAIAPQLFTSVDPNDCGLANSLISPNSEHWFGTDIQGCDYYARVIYGARISMIIGLTVAGATFVIGAVLGGLAGFYSGGIDAVLARITDIWFAIPTILGGVIILSVVQNKGVIQVALVLIVLGWPTLMRIMRSQVLSVKEMDYVAAARALGGNDLRLLRRHIVPNSIAPVVVYTTIFVGIAIVSEATLSFLGIGVQLPAISWGLQLSQAQQRLLTNPHLLIFPGVFLSVTVLSFIVMGDALRDALDPKLR